jgi:hypothetical protein
MRRVSWAVIACVACSSPNEHDEARAPDASADSMADVVAAMPDVAPPPHVSFADLMRQTYDLDGLARAPDPSFRAAQASSYDRTSVAPNQPGWFANNDFGNFVRDELDDGGIREVMLDVAGAGAITRIWAANPAGTLRVYVDGGDPYTVDMAQLLGGGVVGEPFAGARARGFDFYFPIAFARSCKVTIASSTASSLYYQIDYRIYAAGTEVEAFTPDAFARGEVDAARAALAAMPDETTTLTTELALPSGPSSLDVDAPDGGGAIELLTIAPSTLDEATLDATWLLLTFDDRTTASVTLGALFAAAPSTPDFAMLPLAVSHGRFETRLVMPFESHARVTLAGDAALSATVSARVGARTWDARSLRLFAAPATYDAIPTSEPTEVTLLDATGSGRVAAIMLRVNNHGEGWWGEGDEHLWIDGDAFPSFFGTGTEDHFGYAYCSRIPFAAPYHALTQVASPDNGPCAPSFIGRAAMSRAFVLDSIPFTSALKYELEVEHWNTATTIDLDSLIFGYAR